MPTPFDGINEKMCRADEHIAKLRLEIRDFLGVGAFVEGLIPNDGSKEAEKAIREHRKRKVPMRIRVMAGEVIHQTRSTLDHAMWVLAKRNTGRPRQSTQFPIFEERPPEDPSDRERRRWERQTEGLNADGLSLIESFQPYTWSEPKRHALAILKRLNDADKHRSVLVASAHTLEMKLLDFPHGFRSYTLDEGGEDVYEALGVRLRSMLSPTVVFPDLGGKKLERAIDTLTGLHGAVGIVLYRMKKQFFPECLYVGGEDPAASVTYGWAGPPTLGQVRVKLDL